MHHATPLVAAPLAFPGMHAGADPDLPHRKGGTQFQRATGGLAGPSKSAEDPSPVCLARWPPYFSTRRSTALSWTWSSGATDITTALTARWN